MSTLAQRVLAELPQTQCTRCGYPDCAAYAQAITDEQAPINRCPPGGAEGVERLARLTGRAALPLDPTYGTEGPRQMAFIDEDWCIGCTLCLKACPVDAIIGANKAMHTVLEAHCTGCELCIPVCPVDCIHLEPTSGSLTGWAAWSQSQAMAARTRYAQHAARPPADAPPPAPLPDEAPAAAQADPRRAIVEAALARARARRTQS
ncbi:MAG: ferredoxin [Variovorax paradoxus]|nr:MAG: ferredoxin [Variovorax paradoxus]PZQ02170.1 MAG: ferredoxin [Variovorax paradoxus]